MPNFRQKRKHPDDDSYARQEFVIPTPSIDQVLQSLASNALASKSMENEEEQEDDGQNGDPKSVDGSDNDEDNGHDDDNAEESSPLRRSRRKQTFSAQRPSKFKILSKKSASPITKYRRMAANNSSSNSINTKYDSNNKAIINLDRNREQIKRISTRISSKSQQKKVTTTTRRPVAMGNVANKTVSEMLDQLVKNKVDELGKKKEDQAEADGGADELDLLNNGEKNADGHGLQVLYPSTSYGLRLPTSNTYDRYRIRPKHKAQQHSTRYIHDVTLPGTSRYGYGRNIDDVRSEVIRDFEQRLNNTSSTTVAMATNRGAIDPRIESTVEQVVSSLRSTSPVTIPTTWGLPVQPLQFVVHQTMPTSISGSAGVHEAGCSHALQQDGGGDDDDIQIVEDGEDEEEEEGDGEAAPFCKNCASEIPLIIKRLDQLDGMVSRMVTMVKNELTTQKNMNIGREVQRVHQADFDMNTAGTSSSQSQGNGNGNNGHLINRLELQLEIMTNSPGQFTLQTLYNHNVAIRAYQVAQVIAALDSLVLKGYLTARPETPPIFSKKFANSNAIELIQKELGMLRNRMGRR